MFLLAIWNLSAEDIAHKTPSRTAGMLVRSREYVVRRSPHQQEEFIGSVSYKHGDRQAQSDWAWFDHKLQLWRAKGNVHGSLRLKNGDRAEIWGDIAQHDLKIKRGRLEGKNADTEVRFERRTLHGSLEQGTARQLQWDEATSQIQAIGRVHLCGAAGEAWAENALYDHPTQALHLIGRRPVLHYQNAPQSIDQTSPVNIRGRSSFQNLQEAVLQGDKIIGYKAQQRLRADGRVRGWIVF